MENQAKDYDLVVIGGGSGGVRAARIAARHGARVAICEEYRYGGTCVIRGCVPKKLMVYAAQFQDSFAHSRGFGWQCDVKGFNWHRLIDNKDREIARLSSLYQQLLGDVGVNIFHQRGHLKDTHTVAVGSKCLTADKILIATGSTPFMPAIPGIEHTINSNQVFDLTHQPQRVLIVGGGYIAIEFAGIFNGLGSAVTLLYRKQQILRGFDHDMGAHLAVEMQRKGIDLKLQTTIQAIEKLPQGHLRATLHNGEHLDADCILYATGRIPNSQGFGLEQNGVIFGDKNKIVVDENFCTNIRSIFAIGDVTDRICLTPVATMEGQAFATTQFSNTVTTADYECVPSAVFSQPPLATVGLSEHQARQKYAHVAVYRSTFKPLKYSFEKSAERSLIKLIVDSSTDKVVGAHIIDTNAAEILQGLAIAIKAGARKSDFDATVGIHPTSAEEFCTLRDFS